MRANLFLFLRSQTIPVGHDIDSVYETNGSYKLDSSSLLLCWMFMLSLSLLRFISSESPKLRLSITPSRTKGKKWLIHWTGEFFWFVHWCTEKKYLENGGTDVNKVEGKRNRQGEIERAKRLPWKHYKESLSELSSRKWYHLDAIFSIRSHSMKNEHAKNALKINLEWRVSSMKSSCIRNLFYLLDISVSKWNRVKIKSLQKYAE